MTANETHTPTFTFTKTETYTFTPTNTHTQQYTSTETPTDTAYMTPTFTFSFTTTATPTFDAYEYDGTTYTAKVIFNNEPQIRNFWPENDPDFILFSLPSHSEAIVNIITQGTYNFQILNINGATVYHTVLGFLTYFKTGNFNLVVDLQAGNHFIYLTGYNANAQDYSITLNFITLTPTNTFTETNTTTFTYTFTPTETQTFTITFTPTETATKYWQNYGQLYGFYNSGYLCVSENESSGFSLSYMHSGTLYVDTGYSVTTYAEGAFLASRDMIRKRENDTIIVFSDSNANIFAKSSIDNFVNVISGVSIGRGYYPCVEANGNTIFVAFTDVTGGTDMRTSVKYSYQGQPWQYYGGDGGVYNQSDTTQRKLSINSYFSAGISDIYVAYKTEANSIYVKHNNGAGWQQVGAGAVCSSNALDLEISVVAPDKMFCAYSVTSGYSINVKKLSGTNWVDAGSNPVVPNASAGDAEFSLFAVSENEVYFAFQHPVTNKLVVMIYNGNTWLYIGDFNGISQGYISKPNIFKYNNKLYCGFIDWANSGVISFIFEE